MDANELRALADALDDCDPPYYESSPQINRSLDACIAKAADYLRAQADAQPVAAGWKLVPVEPTPEMLSAVGMMDGYDWHAPGCSPDADHANWYSAMIAAAPAAPQAGQPIDLDAVAMQQMRQAAAESTWMPSEYTSNDWINDVCRWLRDGPPQAGPKREPLTYEQLVSACYTYRHDFGLLDPDEQELVIEEAGRWAKAFGIGGSDAE